MSGYNYNNNWRRRGRDSGPQGGRSGQNSSYWGTNHYKNYQNYNQYQYPQLVFPQQWNSGSWNSQSQYSSSTYGRESPPHGQISHGQSSHGQSSHGQSSHSQSSHGQSSHGQSSHGHSSHSHISHSKTSQKQSFHPSRSRSKSTKRSSHRGHSPPSGSRHRRIHERHSSSSSSPSSRNHSPPHQKVISPPLGSEEARKKTLAQATDKIKSCLLSFQHEKSEVLENLLSNREEQKKEEPIKTKPVRLEKPGYAPELQLSPSDLKVIGMVNTSGTGTSSDIDETGNYPDESISANEFSDPSARAEMVNRSSDCSDKSLGTSDEFYSFTVHETGVSGNEEENVCSGPERETVLKDSTKRVGPKPQCTSKRNRYTSETNSSGQVIATHGEDHPPNLHSCIRPRSASLSFSNETNDLNHTKDGTNVRNIIDHSFSSNQNKPKQTLKNLKQRIIQQFLKMGKNNLKDLINNPRSRKFEFAVSHLMKEHRMLLSRELRGLAQSRIRGQDVEIQGQSESVSSEASSLLDTDIAINLSHLPQEVIEQLGNLLQLDLLDSAEAVDFQTNITVEDESNVHDLQNIQALQVALLSEENIKREILDSEVNPRRGKVAGDITLKECAPEKNLMKEKHETKKDIQTAKSVINIESKQSVDQQARKMVDEKEVVFEEGGAIKKCRKDSHAWPDYIPLGKGFMNRGGEFGNLFCEFPDFLGMDSTESEGIDEQDNNVTDLQSTRQTERNVRDTPLSETDHLSTRQASLKENSALETSKTLVNQPDEIINPCQVNVTQAESANNKMVQNIVKPLNSKSASFNETFVTNDIRRANIDPDVNEEAHREESQIKISDDEDNSHSGDTELCLSKKDIQNQSEEIMKDSVSANKPLEVSLNSGGPLEGTCSAEETLKDSADTHKDSAVDNEHLQGSDAVNGIVQSSVGASGTFQCSAGTNAPLQHSAQDDLKDNNVNNSNTTSSEVDKELIINETDNPVTQETDLPISGFKELISETNDISKERCNIDERSCESPEKDNSSDSEGSHNKRLLDTKFNSNDNVESSDKQENANESNIYIEETTSNKEACQKIVLPENQSENVSSDIVTDNDPSNEAMDISINDTETEKLNEDATSSSHPFVTEQDNTSQTEVSKSPCKEIQSEDIDELYGDLSDFSNAEDADGTIAKTQVENSFDNCFKLTSKETEKTDRDSMSNIRSSVSSDVTYKEDHSIPTQLDVQFDSPQTCVEIMEVYRCNVVVKTEKMDDVSDYRTTAFQEHVRQEMNSDILEVGQESQSMGSISQPSFLSNSVQEMAIAEVSTQTEPPDELDSSDIQRMLQLLEKSSQLSPQLAKLLKDHFSSSKVADENELSKFYGSVQSVDVDKDNVSNSRGKSPPCLIQAVNSTITSSPFVHISGSHDVDSVTHATQSAHTSGLSYPNDGMESSFRVPPIIGTKGKKCFSKRTHILTKPSKMDDMRDGSIGLSGGQKSVVGNKGLEGTCIVSSSGAVDIGSPSMAISSSAGTDGEGMSPINTRRDVQETSLSSSKYVFLKMLEIDKEIQKLMELKLELYRKLQLSLEIDSPCLNRSNTHSPKLRGLQYTSPTASKEMNGSSVSQTLLGRMMVSNNSNTQQMHMGLVTTNNNEMASNSFGNDKPTSTSTPMVMLPIDYVLGSSTDLHNTQSSLPRHKLNERLKTFDTSVVEAVLNSFNLPECHNKGEDSDTIHSSDQNLQNKTSGDVHDVSPLKSKVDNLDNNGTNKGRRYASPRLSASHKESHQPERNPSSPKIASPKKQLQKSKLNVNKEHLSVDKEKSSHFKQQAGIATRNKSSSIGNKKKNQVQSNSNTSTRRSVHSDSLNLPTGKELRSSRQLELCEDKEQQENVVKGRNTRQKIVTVKYEDESSQSDSSSVVEDKKETRSSVKSRLSSKNDKRSDGDNSLSSNRSKKNSHNKTAGDKCNEQALPQEGASLTRSRREIKMRSVKDVELQPEAIGIASNRKETRSTRGRYTTSLEEPDISDDIARVKRKRKLSVKADINDSDSHGTSFQEETVKPTTRSRRTSTRAASDSQDSHTDVVDENITEQSRKKKLVKIETEKTDVVDESGLPTKRLTRTTVSSAGHQIGESCKQGNSPERLNYNLTHEHSPLRNMRHTSAAQKRKLEEVEGPPSKVQRLNSKPDLLQWNLQDCFVMVKPLAIDEIDDSKPSKDGSLELFTTNNSGNDRLQSRRSSSSSDELPVTEFVKKSKKNTLSKGRNGKSGSNTVENCFRVDLSETTDEQGDLIVGSDIQQDPLGDIPDVSTCQAQLHDEPYESSMQLPPDLLMQSNSPGRLQGQCILPEIAVQDENSISTLVSDTISVMSDGEQSFVKRGRYDEKNEADLLTHNADGKDDCDRDSSYSCDTAQESREGTNSRASKHKSSKKHRKERKSDGIERLVFEAHEGPILDIKTVGRHVLAASEDGNVYCYSLKSGKFKRKYEGHDAAVTCLCVIECSSNSNVSSELESADGEQMAPDIFFTGSLDKQLRHFRFKTGQLVQDPIDIGSPIQCMDQNWGVVYIGTKMGEVARFSIKTSSLIGEPMKIGREAVLTLKATKEGPRQVLIIGSRNKPIAVRDAATGLLLRTVCNNWSHTVYSLVLGTSIMYCGTKTGGIPAIEFTSGDEVCRFQAGAGVVCMRVYNNLLFAGCYDGNIYVFSIHDKTQVSSITGPGKMLLCMDIVKNRIIAGSKDSNRLEAWGFPQEIRNHLKEAKHR